MAIYGQSALDLGGRPAGQVGCRDLSWPGVANAFTALFGSSGRRREALSLEPVATALCRGVLDPSLGRSPGAMRRA